jgi:hypothetical protein
MLTFRREVKDVLIGALLGIPVSAVVAFLVWFFGGVVLKMDLPVFTDTWGKVYIGLIIIFVIVDVYSLGKGLLRVWAVSTKFKVPFEDAEEAIVTHRLHREDGFKDWDHDKFVQKLQWSRTSNALADSVAKALLHH